MAAVQTGGMDWQKSGALASRPPVLGAVAATKKRGALTPWGLQESFSLQPSSSNRTSAQLRETNETAVFKCYFKNMK